MNLKLTQFSRILKQFGYEKYLQFAAFKLREVEKEVCASNNNGGPFGLSSYDVPLICDGNGFSSGDIYSLKGKLPLVNFSNEASSPIFLRSLDTWANLRLCRELYNHFPMFTSTMFIYTNGESLHNYSSFT